MLVLSRKAGEAVVLAGNITVCVLGVEGDRVKLGIDAPPDVLVLRSELLRNQYPPEQPQTPYPPERLPQPGYRRPRPTPRYQRPHSGQDARQTPAQRHSARTGSG